MKKLTLFLQMAIPIIGITCLTLCAVTACGPTKAEIEARMAEEAKNNPGPIDKELVVTEYYTSKGFNDVKIVKIDCCEYVIYIGENIIHKADCKNPNHK